jgi:hypothetical protein
MKNNPYSASPISNAIAIIDSPALVKQRRKKSGRLVRFLPIVQVKKTTSRHSMTQQEKCNYWLQEDEFVMINQRNRMIIKQFCQERGKHIDSNEGPHSSNINNNNNNNNSECLRGLELGKKSFRLDAFDEVFCEQAAQYADDYIDDEAIAYAYNSVSYECQFNAERTALQDRKDIEDYITV